MSDHEIQIGGEAFAPARLACLNLIHAYGNFVDSGQAQRVPDLFTEDAVLKAGPELVGRAAISNAMTARAANTARRTVHLMHNVQFTEISQEAATAVSILLLFVLGEDEAPLTPAAIARCQDRFVRLADGDWRIQNRSIAMLAGRG